MTQTRRLAVPAALTLIAALSPQTMIGKFNLGAIEVFPKRSEYRLVVVSDLTRDEIPGVGLGLLGRKTHQPRRPFGQRLVSPRQRAEPQGLVGDKPLFERVLAIFERVGHINFLHKARRTWREAAALSISALPQGAERASRPAARSRLTQR